VTSRKVAHVHDIMRAHQLASHISSRWEQYYQARNSWHGQITELRNYLFATDTSTTTNKSLPWKNRTTTPKLTQIRDNLHANYMAALFPESEWLTWEGADPNAETRAKRRAIVAYMKNKLRQSGFEETVSRLVLDYIDYGNAVGTVEFVNETHTTPDGEMRSVYRGPRLVRISPFDHVFDLSAATYEDAPKVTRYLVSHGTLAAKIAEAGEDGPWMSDVMANIDRVRYREFYTTPEVKKAEGFRMDGFSDLSQYLESGLVELLEFEGDIFDEASGKFLHGMRIIVADRSFLALMEPNRSWYGKSKKRHIGWRKRPDNLMAMGPLDNLVGMQYRIDHLENLKADVFDQIATPVVYERGFVNDWQWGPGQKIQGDEQSDVRVLAPDTTALNADFQIAQLMNMMEELAGAPKQAMGIRTPGEKTAYEVQALENAAGRIFQTKIRQFEAQFLEPLLNEMLEVARRNIDTAEVIRVIDDDLGVTEFLTLTPEDITAKGHLVPKGARHFAERANRIQTITSFTASPVYQDQEVAQHISSVQLAEMFVDLLDIQNDKLVRPYVRIAERAEAAKAMQAAEKEVMENAATTPELITGE
jgi:hypothetical protein